MNTARLSLGMFRLPRFSRAKPTPELEPDPAEMGTCFGLDLALPDRDNEPQMARAGNSWRSRLGWLGVREDNS